MRHRKVIASMATAISLVCGVAIAQDREAALSQTLFTNVHIIDGMNEQWIENANVLVEGNLIKTMSTAAIDAPDATVIDRGGRTLMPGLIDSHVHFNLSMDQGRLGMEISRWDTMASYGAAAALE